MSCAAGRHGACEVRTGSLLGAGVERLELAIRIAGVVVRMARAPSRESRAGGQQRLRKSTEAQQG
eukprot:15449903-Alexandrium_andersonii.AAC.1